MPSIWSANTPAGIYVACCLMSRNAKDLSSVMCFGAVEWRFLLSGVTLGTVAKLPNPAPTWLTDKSWTQILYLSSVPAFQVDLQLMLCVFCNDCALSHDLYSLQSNWSRIMRNQVLYSLGFHTHYCCAAHKCTLRMYHTNAKLSCKACRNPCRLPIF